MSCGLRRSPCVSDPGSLRNRNGTKHALRSSILRVDAKALASCCEWFEHFVSTPPVGVVSVADYGRSRTPNT
jgi:hypothetical protein